MELDTGPRTGLIQSATAPPRRQEPDWPAYSKGSQDEDSGGETSSRYLASLEKQAQEREGWANTSPVTPLSPSHWPLLIAPFLAHL